VPADQLSITFAALADPTRRSILTRLAEGEATENELAEPSSVSLSAISRHLKVLQHAGLIVRSRQAQWRPSRLQANPLDDAVEWMLSRKAMWEARMDRLETHLGGTGEQHRPRPRGGVVRPRALRHAARADPHRPRVGGRYEFTNGPPRWRRRVRYEIVELVEPELIVLHSGDAASGKSMSPRSRAWSSSTTAPRRV
jgi:DNA-binding transcriptional ArsR family regulator